ncbi:uncharacterized protein LOC120763751 isoform X2 [Hirundo rustica]|uniref:uncharacterized protein LOC120763751 isoform X2 n=1 Tax=Hirundo rustica TaxID=43150 RepID=UPI001A940956|nr:uncharacterized protein LOC120763751 isoform X2 [Hirundo rustica]
MAGRTVRVQGFPAELPPDRAADKLTIHFLRSRNGGGDIAEVRVLPGSPPCALITFEAPEVAQRILKVKSHVLAIGRTRYPLEVTLHAAELSPDEIFIRVCLTIDYGKLPLGKTLLSDLQKNYSDVQFCFDSKNMHCIVQGPFTQLQTFSRDLLGSLNLKSQAIGEIFLPASSCGAKEMGMQDHQQVPDSAQSAQETAELPNREQGRETAAKVPSPQSPAGGEDVELLGKLEDFSLAMDSDIYLYMQRFCAAEYQAVLHQHHVDVVDVSGNGVAVLYLQPSGGVSGDKDALHQAHLALQKLYQQLEVSLCKEKIAKEGLGMDSQALTALTRELQKLYPQLLCHEDVKQLYLVGNLVDVSQAKQFLQDSVTRRGAPHTVDTLSSSQPSGTTEAALHQAKVPVDIPATRLSPSRPELKGSKPSASRPVLRRSNSFSLPRSKESNNSGDNSSRVSEEMSLDSLQWFYLKDVCHATIDELCRAGGVHISEHHTGDGTVLTLQAADRKRLFHAKWKVEDLVQKCPDLVCQSVSYSELAVDGPDDGDLSELCSLLRGKSFRVGLSKDKYKLHLVCPKDVLPGVTEAFLIFSSRRLCVTKSSSISPGAESTGKSSVIEPSRSQDPVLDAALPGSLNSLQQLNISNQVRSSDVLRASWVPEAEEKRSPSPWRFQQAWGQEEVRDRIDSGSGRGGSSFLGLGVGDKPSPPGLRESQEQRKAKLCLGEPDTTRLKVLPDRFQFAIYRNRGGPSEAMGQQHCPVPAADGAPHSLPTWLSRATAAEPPPAAAQQAPAAEPTHQGRAQLPGDRSNEQEGPDLPSQQRRDPSLGQESSTIPLDQCDACQGCCGRASCRTCVAADSMQPACCRSSSAAPSCKILGTLKISSLSQSLPGYSQVPTLQLAYSIPDGMQGVGDPHPGQPYKGGNFCAFLPNNEEGLMTAKLLKKAFERGLTFQIKSYNGEERVTWGFIPHKTSWDGGKARNGYPDAQYLHEVGTVLNKLALV